MDAIEVTPIGDVSGFAVPFVIVAESSLLAMVPALNGPLGLVLAGALAGYWLAVRRRG